MGWATMFIQDAVIWGVLAGTLFALFTLSGRG
jgi:hypothetical protein